MAGFLDELESALLGEFESELSSIARRASAPIRYATGLSRGSILGQLANLFTRNRSAESRIKDAVRLLESAGFQITQRGVQPINRGIGGRGRQPPPPTRPGFSPPEAPPTRRVIGQPQQAEDGAPPLPGERSSYGEEILTPQSSNVYAFSFSRESRTRGVLYVTFKGHEVHASKTRIGAGRYGGRKQLHGELGATVGRKTNTRGSMYAYFDVPVTVFERMRRAESKGKFVWDELRVRGTIYGHQYTYQLVQGQVSPEAHGQVYVPRRATNRGFSTRSLADQGRGRRGFISSTLPSQRGFATKQVVGKR